MIYVKGDCHNDFHCFSQKAMKKMPFKLQKGDSVIICGDFGLLWKKDKTLEYNLKWLSSKEFRILWVQGNHENYDLIEEYPVESWKGGKVRHIVRDKIILLERGQVFKIEGKKFFTFGGASSHDIQGGILDPDEKDYLVQYRKALTSELPFRVLGKSWWKQELPKEEEMQEGLENLKKNNYKVDYIISHCASNRIQKKVEEHYKSSGFGGNFYDKDILTDYFEKLEDIVEYKKWYFGHYHDDFEVDEKHTLLYHNFEKIEGAIE